MTNKILFVFFGGYNMAEELWNYNLLTMEKTNFLNKIKKIGDILSYYPTFYNIQYYLEKNLKIKKFYKKNLTFELNDISFKKGAKDVYNKINKKYNNIVIISTSIGIHYAIELSKLIKSTKCSIISIEGSHVGHTAQIKFASTIKEYNEKYKKYTNNDLQLLIKNKNYEEINELIGAKLISQINFKLKKFKCPSLHFQNLIIKKDMDNKSNDKNILKIKTSEELSKYDKQYKIIWLINKGHVAFGTDTDNIINNIMNKFFLNYNIWKANILNIKQNI